MDMAAVHSRRPDKPNYQSKPWLAMAVLWVFLENSRRGRPKPHLRREISERREKRKKCLLFELRRMELVQREKAVS